MKTGFKIIKMILTILITSWLTMSFITVAKDYADRNSRNISMLILIFIVAPAIVISEIVIEWELENRRWQEYDEKYNKKINNSER